MTGNLVWYRGKSPSSMECRAKFPHLVAAANLCCHAVTANIGHDVMLEELKRAIDLLKVDTPPCDRLAQPRSKPILRVIEGGLSRAV
jgi:hypothetical protein